MSAVYGAMKRTMSERKPAFWIAYSLLAIASLVAAWQLFPLAIPLVNLEIKLSRQDAIDKAVALAAERKLVPAGFRSAAKFAHDTTVQNYVELEGGGKEAFARLVAGNAYSPYWWEVRLFKAGQIEEATLKFRPDGASDGFVRRLPETYVRDPAIPALTPDVALSLARAQAAADWGVDFARYRPFEQSSETLPSGRVDHRIVFERDDRLADARIRLRLTVAGDELTEVAPYVHVPEAFQRRFAELRSANNTIANVASLSAGVLYGLLGCVLGSLWLLRQHWLLWRPALAAGFVVSGLLAAAILAGSPAAWFGFSTAQPESTFWVRQAGATLLALVAGGLALGLAFMAAESLSRRAFPHHPQLWRLWSREGGDSVEVAGRTAGGYLFVPVELALVAMFYYATNRWFGWWQPSESLTDPNILSSLVPALTPIAISLQAGFLEECVFRAVPLALGALLGARYGHRRLGIAIAFVVQAVIFGGAHANYPGLPPYSRLVELLVPSMLWAAIFLRYGLLPTILFHALFDLVLFSIPLFLIDAPGAWVHRALVVAAALVPAGVVLARRAQAGKFSALPVALWNGAWWPAPRTAPTLERVVARDATLGARAHALQRMLPVFGVVGLAAWVMFTPLRADVPGLPIDRAGAEAAVATAIRDRGATLGPQWRPLSTIKLALDDAAQRPWHAFVWREAGADAYRALVGTVLAPPLWEVRFARFDGDVVERAEEWRASVAGDGQLRQLVHRLPEARPGAQLNRDAALAIAHDALRLRYDLDPAALTLRSADQAQRDRRADWVFVFADPRVVVGPGGEAQIQVVVAGDEVVSTGRAVFVPEAWKRSEAERDGRRQLVKVGSGAFIGLAALAALVYAVVAWSRGRSDRRAFTLAGGLSMAMLLASVANNWPQLTMQLNTVEPVASQLVTSVLATLAGALAVALLCGLLAGVGAWYARRQTSIASASRLPPWTSGVAAALVTAGIAATLSSLAGRTMPLWPELKIQALAWPWAGALAGGFAFVPALVVTLFLLATIDRATDGWRTRIPVAALVLVLFGVAIALLSGHGLRAALVQGVIEGLATLGFAWLVLRHDLTTVPGFVATGLLLEAARHAVLAGTLEGWSYFGLGAAVVIALAAAAGRYLARPIATAAETETATARS